MHKYVFQLFVAGAVEKYRSTIDGLQKCCREQVGNDYELHVVDVLEHPEVAEQEQVMAIPALIKQSPVPVQRIVGDLSETTELLREIGSHKSPTRVETPFPDP